MKGDVLQGKKVYIREMNWEDTEKILSWRNSDWVMKQFLFREPLTKEMHENWIRNKVQKGMVVQFVIGILDSKEEIGSVYFRDIDLGKKWAEFGIFIGNGKHSGKGYGTEAMALALWYAKEKMGMETIGLRVLAENKNAIRVYEKNGFCVIKDREEWKQLDGESRKVIFMEKTFL